MKKVLVLNFLLIIVGINLCMAITPKKKNPDAEEVLKQGREAFNNYDFEEAADLYDQYRSLKTKAKQPIDEELDIWEKELEIATNAFERVQKIVIVDSISVPAKNFFDSYRLAPSAGYLLPSSSIEGLHGEQNTVYKNENGDYLIFPKENEDGDNRLYEKSLLLDGNWDEKETLIGDFEKSGDYVYPFMSADGQTLYFANDGEDSMGGYDIFIAQKDPITGEYRQPLNLGMPFNSPFDDFMLAIDEENGLGWWATNRNNFEDKVTIYVFLYQDIRKNYPSDIENLSDFAKVTAYKATWTDDKFQPITPIMPALSQTLHAEDRKVDFELPLGNGKTYYHYSDFRNRKASDMMKQYLNKKNELNTQETILSQLRDKYRLNKNNKDEILAREEKVTELRAQVKALKSEILRMEKSVR